MAAKAKAKQMQKDEDTFVSLNFNDESYGPPEIDPSEIIYDEQSDFIGEGVFGRVFKGKCRAAPVAVKVPRNQNLSQQELQDLRNEVALMSQIFHPNVVLFMGACTQPGNIKIVTERMTTDLAKLMKSPKGKALPLFVRLKMAKDAAKGMSWLHGINNIIHRDLKPANLLVDNSYTVKVTDFGFSQILQDNVQIKDRFGPRGTALWMAPEVMMRQEYNKSIDIYAFGIILWELLTCEEPFPQYSDWESFYTAVCVRDERPIVPITCPQSLRSLMEDCWARDPKRRPAFHAVVYRLDQILVEVAVEPKIAAQFWLKYFVYPQHELEEIVKWQDFEAALMTETKSTTLGRFQLFYNYLAIYGSDRRVTMHSFSRVVAWFGYFFLEQLADKIADEVEAIIRSDWFHGNIEKTEAEARLLHKPKGCYLVRLSRTMVEYPFTISCSGGRHFRIQRVEGEDGQSLLSIEVKSKVANSKIVKQAESLIELVNAVKDDLGLALPCPRKASEVGYYG